MPCEFDHDTRENATAYGIGMIRALVVAMS